MCELFTILFKSREKRERESYVSELQRVKFLKLNMKRKTKNSKMEPRNSKA